MILLIKIKIGISDVMLQIANWFSNFLNYNIKNIIILKYQTYTASVDIFHVVHAKINLIDQLNAINILNG